MVEAEVQLVIRQTLGRLLNSLPCGIRVCLAIVKLDASKDWIFKANVDADD
jgi:hypothetical protein